MYIKHQLEDKKLYYIAEDANYLKFKSLWSEFIRHEEFKDYSIFVYGGFSSYLMKDPQWICKDIDLFIGRQRVIDIEELKKLIFTLYTLARDHSLLLDIKYFTEISHPDELKWGADVQFITYYKQLFIDDQLYTNFKDYEVLKNGLYKINSVYEIAEKDVHRINSDKTIYGAVDMKKYKF